MHRSVLILRSSPLQVPLLGLAIGAAISLTGCGSDSPELAPVRGVVEFNGKPLTDFRHGAVSFTPEAGRPATGTINPESGEFELSTYSSGDGVRIGQHKVTVSATVDDPQSQTEDKYPGVRFITPEKFADRDTSALTYEVRPGANDLRIQIRSDGSGTVVLK